MLTKRYLAGGPAKYFSSNETTGSCNWPGTSEELLVVLAQRGFALE